MVINIVYSIRTTGAERHRLRHTAERCDESEDKPIVSSTFVLWLFDIVSNLVFLISNFPFYVSYIKAIDHFYTARAKIG